MNRRRVILTALGICALCGAAAARQKVVSDRAGIEHAEDLAVQQQALVSSEEIRAFVQQHRATFGCSIQSDGSPHFAFMAPVERGSLYCEVFVKKDGAGHAGKESTAVLSA